VLSAFTFMMLRPSDGRNLIANREKKKKAT